MHGFAVVVENLLIRLVLPLAQTHWNCPYSHCLERSWRCIGAINIKVTTNISTPHCKFRRESHGMFLQLWLDSKDAVFLRRQQNPKIKSTSTIFFFGWTTKLSTQLGTHSLNPFYNLTWNVFSIVNYEDHSTSTVKASPYRQVKPSLDKSDSSPSTTEGQLAIVQSNLDNDGHQTTMELANAAT